MRRSLEWAELPIVFACLISLVRPLDFHLDSCECGPQGGSLCVVISWCRYFGIWTANKAAWLDTVVALGTSNPLL
jgi:hypothetical protein